MNRPSAAGGVALAWAGVACGGGALALAVFYHGPQIPLLAAAEFLLVAWVALSLAASDAAVRVPVTPVSVTLTLFWLWLAASIAWSTVPVLSTVSFWWVGTVALAFWALTLAPWRDRVWRATSRLALAGALALCAYALAQRFVWNEPPRATFANIHSFGALMLLVALPLGARFLIAWRARAPVAVRCAFGALLFLLCFTIAATEGRGTALGLAFGMALLAGAGARYASGRSMVALIALPLGAYVAANLLLHGGLLEGRLATLADPASAGAPRFLIWRTSWELLMAQPWWGIGLGTYYLAWPPYRHPADTNLGFFAHNDYLQLWIEAGLPALLLLLALYVAALAMVWRLRRRAETSPNVALEALGLFAGLFAVAAHSFVDFNLYVLPISIGAGLALARLHDLAGTVLHTPSRTFRPAARLQPRAYRLIVALLALFPLSYFVALGLADHMYHRGYSLAAHGRLAEADNAFIWATRLLPGDDKVLTMHADLYRHVLSRLPQTRAAERAALYREALAKLDEAQAANPYRPLVHAVRARILRENPDLAGPDWRARAEASYRRALELDPWYLTARMDYAALLSAAGAEEQARRVLAAGLDYWYPPSTDLIEYYETSARAARRAGERAQAAEIEERLERAREAFARLAPPRPVQRELPPPDRQPRAGVPQPVA